MPCSLVSSSAASSPAMLLSFVILLLPEGPVGGYLGSQVPAPASFSASFWARAVRLVCARRSAGWVKKLPGLRNWAGWGWLGRGWDKKLGCALGGEFLKLNIGISL